MSIHTIVINHEEQKFGEFHFDDFRHLNVVETFYCGTGDMVRELEKELKKTIENNSVHRMSAESEYEQEIAQLESEAYDYASTIEQCNQDQIKAGVKIAQLEKERDEAIREKEDFYMQLMTLKQQPPGARQ